MTYATKKYLFLILLTIFVLANLVSLAWPADNPIGHWDTKITLSPTPVLPKRKPAPPPEEEQEHSKLTKLEIFKKDFKGVIKNSYFDFNFQGTNTYAVRNNIAEVLQNNLNKLTSDIYPGSFFIVDPRHDLNEQKKLDNGPIVIIEVDVYYGTQDGGFVRKYAVVLDNMRIEIGNFPKEE